MSAGALESFAGESVTSRCRQADFLRPPTGRLPSSQRTGPCLTVPVQHIFRVLHYPKDAGLTWRWVDTRGLQSHGLAREIWLCEETSSLFPRRRHPNLSLGMALGSWLSALCVLGSYCSFLKVIPNRIRYFVRAQSQQSGFREVRAQVHVLVAGSHSEGEKTAMKKQAPGYWGQHEDSCRASQTDVAAKASVLCSGV